MTWVICQKQSVKNKILWVPEYLDTSWRVWSKVAALTESLDKADVRVDGVSFLKQMVPKNINLFMYCLFLAVRIDSDMEKVAKNYALYMDKMTI